MHLNIFAGKGGVGKTNCAVSLALHLSGSMDIKTAVIDYDGGHSVANTLGTTTLLSRNMVCPMKKNFAIAIVENTDFVGIAEAITKKWTLKEYLAQFPGEFGLIPLTDMVNAFFGVLTDTVTLQKFATLITLLAQLEQRGYERVIIDVEPTAGMERLLLNVQSTARSLTNLQNQGIISLSMIGAKWPHIAGYLKGDYIKHADKHAANIQHVATLLTNAKYMIVSTPEASPINQTFEVRRIIEKFGGKVHGYVVNNLRGEAHEASNISRLDAEGLPVVKIGRQAGLHSGKERTPILLNMGALIARELV